MKHFASLDLWGMKGENEDTTGRLDEVYAKEDSTLEAEVVAIEVASIGQEKW